MKVRQECNEMTQTLNQYCSKWFLKILYKLNSKGLSSTEKTWLLAEEVSTAIVIKALLTL